MLTFFGHFSGASSYPVVCRAIAKWLASHERAVTICDFRGGTDVDLELRGVPRVAPFEEEKVRDRIKLLQQDIIPSRDDVTTSGTALLFGFPGLAWACPPYERFVGYHVPDVDVVPDHWVAAIDSLETQVFTPSKWGASVLKSCGVQRRVDVVRHGIDPEVFCPGESPREERRVPLLRFFCSSEAGTRKGLFELVAAWKILWGRRPGLARLVVRGAGPLVKREFGGLPGVTVEIGEPMRPTAMARVLRETDLLLVPSRAEGFGIIPIESVACGVPAVVTDCTGHAEWARSFGGLAIVESGDLTPCPPGPGRAPSLDPEHLADVIESAVRELPRLQAEALKASAVVRRKWSWEAVLAGSALDRLTGG